MVANGSGAATLKLDNLPQGASVTLRCQPSHSGFNTTSPQLSSPIDLSAFDLDKHLGLPSTVDFDLSEAMHAAAATTTTTPTSALFNLPSTHDDLLDLDLTDIEAVLQSTDNLPALSNAEEQLLNLTPIASPIGEVSFETLLNDMDLATDLPTPTSLNVELAAPILDNDTCPEAFRPRKPKRTTSKRSAKARATTSTESSEQLTAAGTLRKRSKKVAVADHLKDEAYWEYRRKNNERAKRSREAKSRQLLAEKNKLKELNDEHKGLQDEAVALRTALSELVVELEQRVAANYGTQVPESMQALLTNMKHSARGLKSGQ